MKALIINIDRNYRSVYTGMIAACLLKKIPGLKITGFVSSDNMVLKTTGHFEDVKFLDAEAFFSRTKNLASGDVEKEIKTILGPLKDVKWDVVINLSSNLLGSILVNFLEYKEVRGIFLDKDLSGLKYTDLPSFCLARVPDDFSNYMHFTYLYRSILKRFEDISLASVWKQGLSEELKGHFDAFKARCGKSRIVLLDANICRSRRTEEIEFVAQLYRHLEDESEFLPVFVGRELEDGEPLVKRIKDGLKGEIHSISCQNEAYLSVVGLASLVITDDLYLKAISDLAMLPSILLSRTLNTSDFSIVPGSLQLVAESFGENLQNLLPVAIRHVLKEEDLYLNKVRVDVYKTRTHVNLPVLEALNSEGTPEYANWWLGLKYLTQVQKISTPSFKVNAKFYRNAIFKERQALTRKETEGMYSFAMELAKSDVGANPFTHETQVVQSLNQFFTSEESSL